MTPVEKDPAAGLNAAVAATFRGERGALGMTIEELADQSGVPARSLMRFLNAQRHMDMAVVEAIARALNMTPAEAIEGAQLRLAKAHAELPQLDVQRGVEVEVSDDYTSMEGADRAARSEDAEKPTLGNS